MRKLTDQAPPRVASLPYFVPANLRAVEQTGKMRQHLCALSPESFRARIIGFANGRREIARGELAMCGRDLTDGILERYLAIARPDQEPDQGVARDAQRCFFATSYDCLKIVQRLEAAGEGQERYREPGDVPEIPSGGTGHHVGTEAGKDGHADQEQPAILREQGNENDSRKAP